LEEVGARSDFVYTVMMGARGARWSFATSMSGGADARQGMQVGDDLGVVDGAQRRGAHYFVQLVFGLEQAGRVGENELAVGAREQADYRSRVDCGLGETIARCSPTSAFRRVDFPTLGFPASATTPQRVIR